MSGLAPREWWLEEDPEEKGCTNVSFDDPRPEARGWVYHVIEISALEQQMTYAAEVTVKLVIANRDLERCRAENERLMNVDYWPERVRALEIELDRMRLEHLHDPWLGPAIGKTWEFIVKEKDAEIASLVESEKIWQDHWGVAGVKRLALEAEIERLRKEQR